MIENLKDRIVNLMQRYNPDHDIDVDFNWVDASIIDMFEALLTLVEEQDKRIHQLEMESWSKRPLR